MRKISYLLVVLFLKLAVTTSERPAKSRSRVCSVQLKSRTVSYLTSHAQPIYQPYLTLCAGSRLCSTYRTIYRTAQRLAYRKLPQPSVLCCPGWTQRNSPSGHGCNTEQDTSVCRPPCQNAGRYLSRNKCSCAAGWTGRCCETDVDECAGGRHGCSQLCLNAAGSFRCGCQQGYELHTDGKTCLVLEEPTPAPETTEKGGSPNMMMQDEVRELKSRVSALEEKFELTLAPFLKLELPGTEGTVMDAIGLLVLSLQQLDRIDSLSEQISFLEERLETCSCKKEQ